MSWATGEPWVWEPFPEDRPSLWDETDRSEGEDIGDTPLLDDEEGGETQN